VKYALYRSGPVCDRSLLSIASTMRCTMCKASPTNVLTLSKGFVSFRILGSAHSRRPISKEQGSCAGQNLFWLA
jgi:hypothetical protein